MPLAALPLFLFASAFWLMISMIKVVAMDIGKMVEMELGLSKKELEDRFGETVDYKAQSPIQTCRHPLDPV